MHSAPQLASRPASHQHAAPRRRIYRFIFSAALITSAATFIAPLANAQDLGEIARQERAKKQNNPTPPSTHVYTNEDMQRQQILTPEDKALFSATTQPATAKPAQSATQLSSESTPPAAPIPLAAHSSDPAVTKAVEKTVLAPATGSIVHKVTATVSVQTPQPVSATVNVAAAQPVAQIPVTQIIVAQTIAAPSSATVPLDQMPLGDVARFYREKKRLDARAHSQTDSSSGNVPSAPMLASTILSATSLDQLPLGDVARYYRAKKREEDAAIANASASTPDSNPAPSFSVAPVQRAQIQSAASRPSKLPSSPYPLEIATMPLASMNPPSPNSPPPARKLRSLSPNPAPSIVPTAPPTCATLHAISIRVARGDTLWKLARHYLGSAARWQEVVFLNPSVQDPRRLQIGIQLVLHTTVALDPQPAATFSIRMPS